MSSVLVAQPHQSHTTMSLLSPLRNALLCTLLASGLISGVHCFAPKHGSAFGRRSATALGYTNGVPNGAATGTRRPQKVVSIEGTDELRDFLAEDDRLCLVKVYANWCKTCKAFDLRYRKLATKVGDKFTASGNVIEPGRVRFAEIEFSANEELCRGLDATLLPYILVYKGASCTSDTLTRFQCGPSSFQKVIDAVDQYADATTASLSRPAVANPDFSGFESTMAQGSTLGDHIVSTINSEASMQNNNNSPTTASFADFRHHQHQASENDSSRTSFEQFCSDQK